MPPRTMKKEPTLPQAILMLLFIILWIPAAAMLSGVVLNDLWDWFIVPLGVPGIPLAQAMGLSLIVSYLTYHKNVAEKVQGDSDDEKLLKVVAHHLFRMGFTWLFGRILVAFI